MNSKIRLSFYVGILLPIWFVGCNSNQTNIEQPESIDNPKAVAQFRGDQVTLSELDKFILQLPPQQRTPGDQDASDWCRDQIREILMQRALLDQAQKGNLASEESYKRWRSANLRNLFIKSLILRDRPGFAEVSEEDLKKGYEERRDQFKVDEKRLCLTIFRRAENEKEKKQELELMNSISERLSSGESFKQLAKTYSDSETRYRQGVIGWIVRGMLPAEFEKIVFSLKEGVPSKPIVSTQGVHIFLIESIVPEKSYTLEEVRKQVLEAVQQERFQKVVNEISEKIPVPSDLHMVDEKTLKGFLEKGDGKQVCLEYEDVMVRVEDLIREINSMPQPVKGKTFLQVMWQRLNQHQKMLLLALKFREENPSKIAALEKMVDISGKKVLIQSQRNRNLTAMAKEQLDKLQLFYESNIGRFSSPEKVKLNLVQFPLDKNTPRLVVQLEKVSNKKVTDLEKVKEMGGTSKALDWQLSSRIKFVEPKLPSLISNKPKGYLSPPFHKDNHVVMAWIQDKELSSPIPFQECLPQVAVAYVDQYEPVLYRQLAEKTVPQNEVKISESVLKGYLETGLVDSEGDIKEIEKLLNELDSQK